VANTVEIPRRRRGQFLWPVPAGSSRRGGPGTRATTGCAGRLVRFAPNGELSTWFTRSSAWFNSPAQGPVQVGAQKANSYVQPSTFDKLAGESPASAMDG
jgi:hypothetical protein